MAAARVADLTHEPIAVAALLDAVRRPECGATALFLGTTRDHHDGQRVERLEYEAYEPMARAALAALEGEAARRFPIAACRIVHRLGLVPIAEASVAVAVSAAHRAAAFDACRWAMDTLKREAPIWKKEFFAAGGSAWVEGTPLGGP